ncbi:putative urate catabolism protein [Albimonas donghaensis]|uniref:Chitooligosaccharide deacetylase n=1 Tax=Albimonas donghaensis TaxID=356660 RepID=A0A1H2XB52_9RHOB|nr:putative urate catabolism protein [Albimonas donghaensis]
MLDPDYPRDLIGYGANPPDPEWPKGAKLALNFVINYEEGSEYSLLHGDDQSEAFLSEVTQATNWPGQRHWNMESMYEYGSRAGFWRLHRIFTQRDLPVTVYGVAMALARNPEAVAGMKAAGWEIASHGLRWIEYKDFTVEAERAHLHQAIAMHTEATGERPLGWYTGRCSVNTVDIVAAEGGFEYAADSYADDLPYWHHAPTGPQLILPYTLDANDARFISSQGWGGPRDFHEYLSNSVEVLLEEGRDGAPKMMTVGLHCRLVGRPGRAAALKRFLDEVAGRPEIWVTTRLEIARHWKARFPAPAA